jgi:hypothetical protein
LIEELPPGFPVFLGELRIGRMTEGLLAALLGILRTVSRVFFEEPLLSDNRSS